MKKISPVLIDFFIKIIQLLSIISGFRIRIIAGKLLGSLAMLIGRKRKAVTIQNLENAFPEKSLKWHKDTAKKAYHNLGITYLELLAMKSFDERKTKKYIRYENPELINEVYKRGRGVILLSGHFGNWELLAFSAGVYSRIPILIIVRNQKYGDKIVNECRTAMNNEVVGQYSSGRKVITAIRDGRAVAILADQNPPAKEGIFVNFFGRPTLTFKSPAELSLKYGVPIIMGFSVRDEKGIYHVTLKEVKSDDLKKTPEGIKELTQRHINVLEEAIREHPHLWAWQHRRWKQSPDPDDTEKGIHSEPETIGKNL